MKREPEEGVLADAEQDTNGVRMSPSTAGPHARLSGLINTFAWANRALFNAARAVEALQGDDAESLTDEVLL